MLNDHDQENIDELQHAASEILEIFTNCVQGRIEDAAMITAVSILESVILTSFARNVEIDSFMEAINSFIKSIKHNAYTIESEIASGKLEI